MSVSNACGWAADTIQVTLDDNLPIDLGEDRTLCEGETLVLQFEKNLRSFQWQDGSAVPTMPVSQAGLYWVIGTNACGVFTDTVRIAYDPNVLLKLQDTIRACAGEMVSLQAGPYYSFYQWSDGSTDSVLTVTETGLYQVVVENACGRQMDQIYVEFNEPAIHTIPNVITPNGDDRNDSFVLDRTLQGAQIQIYNRWGKRVYQSPNYRNTWNALDLPAGIYFYQLDHPCLRQTVTGSVHVLRTKNNEQ